MSGLLLRTGSGSLPISGLTAFSGDPTADDLAPIQKNSDNAIVSATVQQLFGAVGSLPAANASISGVTLVAPMSGAAEQLNVANQLAINFSPADGSGVQKIYGFGLPWQYSAPFSTVAATSSTPLLFGTSFTNANYTIFSCGYRAVSYARDWRFAIKAKFHAENNYSRMFFGVHDGTSGGMVDANAPAGRNYMGIQFSGVAPLRGDAAPRLVVASAGVQTFQNLTADPLLWGNTKVLELRYVASTTVLSFYVNGVLHGATVPGVMVVPTAYNMRPMIGSITGTVGKTNGLWVGATFNFESDIPAGYKV